MARAVVMAEAIRQISIFEKLCLAVSLVLSGAAGSIASTKAIPFMPRLERSPMFVTKRLHFVGEGSICVRSLVMGCTLVYRTEWVTGLRVLLHGRGSSTILR